MDWETKLDTMVEAAARRFAFLGVDIPTDGVLAGPGKRGDFRWRIMPELDIGWDNAHFPLNTGLLLTQGLPALLKRAEAPRSSLPPLQAKRRAAVAAYLRLFIDHIAAHACMAEAAAKERPADRDRLQTIARNCRALTAGPPQDFLQAVQLFYFAWRARTVNYTACIGRLDLHLRPFYEGDVPARLSRVQAGEILAELWRKLNQMGQGDTLMNLMLGGVDAQGQGAESDLSLLMMEITSQVALSEPHINLRIREGMPGAYRAAALDLIAKGQGQGTLYDDDAMIPELVRRGYPMEIARNYANDGCTEITFDGQSDIQFWQMEAVKTLELALFNGEENPCAPHTPVRKWSKRQEPEVFRTQLRPGFQSGDLREAQSFDEVWAAYLRQFDFQIDLFLARIAEGITKDRTCEERQTSLLVSALTPRTLDEGLEPIRGGFETTNYQLLSGSLPTAADGLWAIRDVIFEQKESSMGELLDALAKDFDGQEPLRQRLLHAPKFGNDHDGVDALAAGLAAHFIRRVEAFSFPENIPVLPGIYNIDFVMNASGLGATPDGRHAGEPICAHYSPTPGVARQGPTAVLRSASKAPLAQGCAASPVYLTLPAGAPGADLKLSDLLQGIHRLGLPVVNLSVADPARLLDAMEHPENHGDLVVRVWGYNARFVDLDRPLQQHILTRILS